MLISKTYNKRYFFKK